MPLHLHFLANPKRFLNFTSMLKPIIGSIGLLTGCMGLFLGLLYSPADYQQGETVRIMYIHVPAAWLAMFCYTLLAATAISALVWKHPLASYIGQATAPVGATLTAICLATGMIWGKPTWGAWWVWDARLTSVLILFFLFIGYSLLLQAFEEKEKGFRAAALLALLGIINIPIIKFSVEWWNTLHQPASISSLERLANPAIHTSMLYPLLCMVLAYMCYTVWIILERTEALILENKHNKLR